MLEKGYFKKDEFILPRKQFTVVWKKLWSDTKEDKLMLYSYSPYEPNEPNALIILIGPPETVDKKLKFLKDITDSNKIN